jgi:Flp pilus assembly protein TadD/molybdopterin-guanine dinucleotide biosynthesis protein
MSVLMDALKKVEETKKTKLESATSEKLSESPDLIESDEELQIFEITDNMELKHTPPQLEQISESSLSDLNQELLENFKETDLPETILNDNDKTSLKKQSIDESVSQFQNDEAHSSSHNWDDDFLPEFQSTIEQLDSSVPETDKAIEESTDWNKELVFEDFDADKKLTVENSPSRLEFSKPEKKSEQIVIESSESRFTFEKNKIQSEQTPAENSESRFESVNHDTKKNAPAFWNQTIVDDFKEDEIELEKQERKISESAPLEKGNSIFSNFSNEQKGKIPPLEKGEKGGFTFSNDTNEQKGEIPPLEKGGEGGFTFSNESKKDSPAFPFEQHEPWQSHKNTREKDHSTEVKKEVPLSKTETKGDSFSETIIHQPPQPEDAKRILAANGSPPPSSKKSTWILLGVMTIVAIGVGSLFFMPSLTESPSTLKFGQLNRRIPQPTTDNDKPSLLPESSTSSTLSIAPIPSPPPSNLEESAAKKAFVVASSTTETRQSSNESTNNVPTQTPEKLSEQSSTPPAPNKSPTPSESESEAIESSDNSKLESFNKSTTSKEKKTKSLKAHQQAQGNSKTQDSSQSQDSNHSQAQGPENSQAQESESLIIIKKETSPPTDTPDIYVRKNLVNPISQEILTGYNAFQRGDNNTAYQAYQRALQQDNKNRDALLGLGALAIRSGKMRLAQYYYQRVLKLYPQDSYALVGFSNTLDKRSPESESQLKLLLEQTPQSAHIHFSLGTFYANQGQWAKAQQAYFDAYRYDKTQADYAYNLAVSLEQINQPGTALTYYQKALQLAQHQVVNFSPAAAQKRVQTLLTQTRASALTNLSTE